jgi:hypothetical protein
VRRRRRRACSCLRRRANPATPSRCAAATEKVANRRGRGLVRGGGSRGRFATPARIPSTRWYPVPGATRTTLGFGMCPSFKDHSLPRRPTLESRFATFSSLAVPCAACVRFRRSRLQTPKATVFGVSSNLLRLCFESKCGWGGGAGGVPGGPHASAARAVGGGGSGGRWGGDSGGTEQVRGCVAHSTSLASLRKRSLSLLCALSGQVRGCVAHSTSLASLRKRSLSRRRAYPRSVAFSRTAVSWLTWRRWRRRTRPFSPPTHPHWCVSRGCLEQGGSLGARS